MAESQATRPYADYEWYTGEYGGTLLTATTYPRYARWASSLIDSVTYGNIKSDDQVTDAVKDACCCAAELAYNYWRSSVDITTEDGKIVSSESNDGYSISYGENSVSTSEELQKEAIAQIRVYLQNTGLLFRGIMPVRKRRRWIPW